MEPKWLARAKELHAIAQAGITFCRDPFDRQRFERLREIAGEMFTDGFPMDPVSAALQSELGYPTPKVDVRAVVFDEEKKILLVREVTDGLWALPGGWADTGLSPSQNAEKEVKEETGYLVRAERLLAVLDRRLHHAPYPFDVYKLFFACELLGGSPQPSIETLEVGFFREDALPPLSVGRVTENQLRRMLDAARRPNSPTLFD